VLWYNLAMHTLLRLLLTLVLAVTMCPASAEVVGDLYSARTPVADRSEQALVQAAREGLAQVVLKITGSESALALEDVAAALAEARRYLQQYAYVDGEGDGAALELSMQFDEEAVRSRVISAGAPLWTANRPAVLVWLVSEGDAQRQLVGEQTHPQLLAALRAAFDRRGVPLRVPLLDLSDLGALSPGQVWRQELLPLVAASARYGENEILAGRVLRLSSGQWLGDWMHIDGQGRSVQRSFTAQTLDEVLALGAGLAASRIAARYAITADVAGAQTGVDIEVRGINDYANYAEVIAWLQGLELIEFASPEQVGPQQMLIHLRTAAAMEQLQPLLALNPRLQLLGTPQGGGRPVYRWLQP